MLETRNGTMRVPFFCLTGNYGHRSIRPVSGRAGASGRLYAGLQVFGLDQWAGGAGTFVLVAGFCPDRSGSAVAALPVGRLPGGAGVGGTGAIRSEEHTSELQSLTRNS